MTRFKPRSLADLGRRHRERAARQTDRLVAFVMARADEDGRLPLDVRQAIERIVVDRWGGPDHEDMWFEHVKILAAIWSDHEDYELSWVTD